MTDAARLLHDLRNHVATILANTYFLRQRPRDADDELCLDDIDAAARRIADIAGHVLTAADPT